MVQAGEMVPKSAVLNSWLSYNILLPYHKICMRDLLQKTKGKVEPYMRPFRGTEFESAGTESELGASDVKKSGEYFHNIIDFTTSGPILDIVDSLCG